MKGQQRRQLQLQAGHASGAGQVWALLLTTVTLHALLTLTSLSLNPCSCSLTIVLNLQWADCVLHLNAVTHRMRSLVVVLLACPGNAAVHILSHSSSYCMYCLYCRDR